MEKYYQKTQSVNTQKPRAYYVSFDEIDEKSYNREKSGRFSSLNGDWAIRDYESVSEADGFWMGEGDKIIPVPSCVQYFGYDYMQYTNINYPFAYDPPHIPTKNPAFHYSRRFDLKRADEKNGKKYLVFEGVDSCFYVYVNGTFVGYSCVSHRISEFDVTPFVLPKNNKLDVLVVKWNAGSYLEDQDKWRMTGIFRDVYLLERPEKHIWDYSIVTKIDGSDGIVSINNRSDVDFTVFFNGEERVIGSKRETTFVVKNATFWSAETPNLYDLIISTPGEKIYRKVGICKSEVKDGIYLFNGEPIKFRGVNRHDFHPEKGYAVNYADMKKDVELMKELNVNAVRTSHYPSSPLFYELCEEYGLYVISESDLETHGSTSYGEPGYDYDSGMCLFANNEFFLDSVVERQILNIEEHKNFSCIVMFSLGNESGWGKNFDVALKKAKELTSKPLHYEGLWAYNSVDQEEYYKVPLDTVSRMYPTPEWMEEEYLNDIKEKRPLVLCEYAHSMGNGPGGLKEYWDVMESSQRFAGAFIWEWADHGMRYGSKGLRYGGDYGEFEHDGNYCVDGIVSADRKIKSGTLAMKKAYQPILFHLANGVLTVFNKNYFKTETGNLSINGKKQAVSILPRNKIEISCEEKNVLAEYFVNGESVAFEQFVENSVKINAEEEKAAITEEGRRIFAKISNGVIVFDKDSGEIESVDIHGVQFENIKFNLWRAPTDNDRNIRCGWDEHFLRFAKAEAREYKICENKIEFDIVMTVPRYMPLIKMKAVYTFVENGVEISIDYVSDDKNYIYYMPRIGVSMKLDKSFSKLKYVAYGPWETYSDSYLHTVKDEYESTVAREYHHYVKPQESGSHFGADKVSVSNGKVFVTAFGMQSFSVLPYSSITLTNAMHDYELPESDGTYVSLDYFMSGLGTNSCGPMPQEKYRVPKAGKGKITVRFDKI